MELLIVILLLIIGLLTFLLLKKERVLGIKPETANKNTEVKIVESKEYRKNIFDLLNSIPEGILILNLPPSIDGTSTEVPKAASENEIGNS